MSLEVPVDGIVVVSSSATADASVQQDQVRCTLTTGTVLDSDFLQQWMSGGLNDSTRGALAGVRGFNVTAGVLTVNLVCDSVVGGSRRLVGFQPYRDLHPVAMKKTPPDPPSGVEGGPGWSLSV